MQRWTKLGLIFEPDRSLWWQRSHASLPSVLPLGGSRHRVYFTSRDDRGRSHVGWFDLDLGGGEPRVLERCDEPVLAAGPPGSFDADGVWAASAVAFGSQVRLYTIGWNVGVPPPMFRTAVGLAVSADGGRTFAKHGAGPILDRSLHDPCLVSAPFVLCESGRWRMWYLSGVRWDEQDGRLRSVYHVKYAESADGIDWRRDGHVAIPQREPQERNVARACVVPDGGRYRAWYSSDAGAGYRIGYAESRDGLTWERRDDEAVLEGTVAYPFVLRGSGAWWMLYNGDGFGRAGIGLAVGEA